MKASEIKELTDDELRSRYEDSTRELFNLRMQKVSGQIENPLRLRTVRRELARMKTVMNQRVKNEATA